MPKGPGNQPRRFVEVARAERGNQFLHFGILHVAVLGVSTSDIGVSEVVFDIAKDRLQRTVVIGDRMASAELSWAERPVQHALKIVSELFD